MKTEEKFSYRLGRILGRAPAAFYACVALTVVLLLLGALSDRKGVESKDSELDAQRVARQELAAKQAATTACAASAPEMSREYDRLMKKRAYHMASLTVVKCASDGSSDEWSRKYRSARLAMHREALKASTSPGEKADVIEMLFKEFPDEAKPMMSEVARLRERQVVLDKARIAREKRSRGVSIGMSSQDVLDSSWGAPDHVNRTTTRYGVREQWVYGHRNYLYFKDGVLESIQN